MADNVAKEATKNSCIDLVVSCSKTEINSIIKQRLKERWQKQWEEERKGRWFYRVQRKVGEIKSTGRNRRDKIESIISRLRFGLNSSLFIIGKHGTGRCECGQEETIEHVMLNCQRYEEQRRHLVGNLTELGVPYNLTDILQNYSRN